MISSPLMTVMVDAVRKASRGLRRDFGEVENLQVSRKGPGDFVSAADRKAEEVLRDALMKARPGYSLVLEENGVTVWLDAPLAMVKARIQDTSDRPLARDPVRFEHLFFARRAAYQRADYRVEISGDDPAQAVSAILRLPIF